MFRIARSNLRARTSRTLLSAVAVSLGVAFVVGTLVLTATLQRSYDRITDEALAGVDAVVRGPALFESLAIIEYIDEVYPHPPLLPSGAKARARVRGLAQIVAADSHPLIVPRVREYLAHEFKVDEAGVAKWAQHWHKAALSGLEEHLATEKDTGTYCQDDQITIADICLVSQVAGANFFKVDMSPYPTVARIAAACAKNDAFARAHPLKQPGAPAPL